MFPDQSEELPMPHIFQSEPDSFQRWMTNASQSSWGENCQYIKGLHRTRVWEYLSLLGNIFENCCIPSWYGWSVKYVGQSWNQNVPRMRVTVQDVRAKKQKGTRVVRRQRY
jgi:hypothetical protein